MDDDYTFPFDTCEKPTQQFELMGYKIEQPYSVMINTISLIIILYYLSKPKSHMYF